MVLSESDLEMVRRHVSEGERPIALQHRIIAHLREIGGSTELAEQLLAEFERTLLSHRRHLARAEAPEPPGAMPGGTSG